MLGPTSGVAVDVSMVHGRGVTVAPESLTELVGDDDAAVPSTGTADADREVRLALALVTRERQREQRVELFEVRVGSRAAHHVVADALVATVERTQLVDPVRVRQ